MVCFNDMFLKSRPFLFFLLARCMFKGTNTKEEDDIVDQAVDG